MSAKGKVRLNEFDEVRMAPGYKQRTVCVHTSSAIIPFSYLDQAMVPG
jgi:hypothetical protein